MTTILPQCYHCTHSHGDATCEAYPEGIPLTLLWNRSSHKKSYPGDNGILYERKEPIIKGGPGSGFYGHKGRKGEGRGGSLPRGEGGGGEAQDRTPYPEGMVEFDKIPAWEMKQLDEGTGTHTNWVLADSASLTYNEKLDYDDVQIVKAYTGGAYSRWNDHLRGILPYELSEEDKGYTDKLTKIVENAPKYEGTTYRGINGANDSRVYDLYSNLKEGQTFTDKGFVSASLSNFVHNDGQLWREDQSDRAIRMTIEGKQGYVLASAAQNGMEREVLYNRDTSFEVLKNEIMPDGGVKIHVREI